jgi:hypothetical protein
MKKNTNETLSRRTLVLRREALLLLTPTELRHAAGGIVDGGSSFWPPCPQPPNR